MDRDLKKGKAEALAVVSVSTVILIVCFSMGLVLLSLQALEAKLELGALVGSARPKRMALNVENEA